MRTLKKIFLVTYWFPNNSPLAKMIDMNLRDPHKWKWKQLKCKRRNVSYCVYMYNEEII